MTVPLSEFLALGVPVEPVNRILHGEVVVDSVLDPTDELKFRQWEREFHADDPHAQRAARIEIQARLIRLAGTVSAEPVARHPEPALSRADQIACYIARNYHKPLTADGIARAIGLHPNYAMSLFRRAFGTAMTSFITQHRIWHSQRLLFTTDDTVLDVALAAGFQSLSRFNEAFKRACGCSPREYRKAHR